jgi:hypothetical protein
MKDKSDAYRVWLGIPTSEQPPHHYRLLGIQLYETDPAVIDHAATRQSLQLKSVQTGPHARFSQQLLNEVRAASICLHDARKKAEYDAHLAKKLGRVEQPAIEIVSNAVPRITTSSRSRPAPAPKHKKPTTHPVLETLKIIVGSVAGLFLAVLVLSYFADIDVLGWKKSKKPMAKNEAAKKPLTQATGGSRQPSKPKGSEIPRANAATRPADGSSRADARTRASSPPSKLNEAEVSRRSAKPEWEPVTKANREVPARTIDKNVESEAPVTVRSGGFSLPEEPAVAPQEVSSIPGDPPKASGATVTAPTPPNNKPTPASIASSKERTLWRHSNGYFEHSANDDWIEYHATGYTWSFRKVSQSAEFVELERDWPNCHIRLYANHCEYAHPPFVQYEPLYQGTWGASLESLALGKHEAAIKQAIEGFSEAISKAKKTLLARFETTISVVRKKSANQETKLALLEALIREQARFEQDGLVPWSLPMRPGTVDYIGSINKASIQAERSFDQVIGYFTNRGDVFTANSLIALKQKNLAPFVIAKLKGHGIKKMPRDIAFRLFSNGHVNGPGDKWSWEIGQDCLVLHLAALDRIVIADFGVEFSGGNSRGGEYAGTFLSGLDRQDKHPNE